MLLSFIELNPHPTNLKKQRKGSYLMATIIRDFVLLTKVGELTASSSLNILARALNVSAPYSMERLLIVSQSPGNIVAHIRNSAAIGKQKTYIVDKRGLDQDFLEQIKTVCVESGLACQSLQDIPGIRDAALNFKLSLE